MPFHRSLPADRTFLKGCTVMRWEELGNAYPRQWVVIEAVTAHTDGAVKG